MTHIELFNSDEPIKILSVNKLTMKLSPNHDPHRIVQLCDEPIKILSVNKLTMKL